ncbi:hypothetical protein [Alteriqipengyuania sp.]|uniref:hypothetical protein n=1 Tax=Alteriqipengyuania sp. TaxID=2800692 RepID=UPI00351978E5
MMAGKKQAEKDPRNVTVEALRPHQNSYGDKFAKAKGDTYVHPRPRGDIAGGVVKLAEEAKTAPAQRVVAADRSKG